MFEHASYSFPSWILIPLELLLVLAAAGGLWLAFGRLRRASPRLTAFFRVLSGRPVAASAVLVAATLGGQIATTVAFGPPIPFVVDEQAYHLAADTFARGRLTNPPLEPAEAFACPHVLKGPTRQSKYPPAQGALLGLGQALGGHAVVGVWISSVLLVLSAAWCLRAFVPLVWSLLGALLVALRFGVGSYWGQSYWGGHVAAIGGLLLLGGLGRWWASKGRGGVGLAGPVAVGLGVALLLTSRPFEGACAILGALGASLLALRRGWRPTWPQVAAAAVPVVLGLATLALTNHAITGSVWRLPHTTYTESIEDRRHFVWNSLEGETPWPLQALVDGVDKIQSALFFQLGVALLVGVVVLLPRIGRRRGAVPALAILGATLLAHVAARPYFPHYTAPATGAFLLLGVHGLREMGRLRWNDRRLGMAPALAALAVYGVLFLVQSPAHRPDADSDVMRRLAIDARLDALAGRHLVLAEPGDFWSCNGAEPLQQDVLWARSLGATADAVLIDRFADRRPWIVARDLEGVPRLEPWPGD